MTTLLFGAHGQLGFSLQQQLGGDCAAFTRAEVDFVKLTAPQLRAILDTHEPAYILNAAAYTEVDAAETDRALATHINGTIPALLAAEAQTRGIALYHFSTDYVFDGLRGAPYTEKSAPNPRNHYGASKLEGEQAVLAAGGTVFRLQWLYDTRGKNFFRSIRARAEKNEALRVVADQLGSPSYVPHVAQCVIQAMQKNIPAGLYHLAAGGFTSWHGFAASFVASVPVDPIITEQYPTSAIRPLDTRLNCTALAIHGIAMPHWREGLREAMTQI